MAKEKIEIKEIQAIDKGFKVTGTVDPNGAPIDFVATTFQWVSNSGTPTGFELKDAERWAVQLGEGFEVRPCVPKVQ